MLDCHYRPIGWSVGVPLKVISTIASCYHVYSTIFKLLLQEAFSLSDNTLVATVLASELEIKVLVVRGCLEGQQFTEFDDKARLVGSFIAEAKLLMMQWVQDINHVVLFIAHRFMTNHITKPLKLADYFSKGSFQFKVWDPGGCCFVRWEGLAELTTSWKIF